MRHRIIIIYSLIFFLIFSCTARESTYITTPVPTPLQLTPKPTKLPTATATRLASTPTNTPPSTPSSLLLSRLDTPQTIKWIITQKQNGASLNSVTDQLVEAEKILPKTAIISIATQASWAVEADLNQDEITEWVLSLWTHDDVESCGADLGGEVIILNERGLLYTFNDQDYTQLEGDKGVTPVVALSADITGDNRPDLILQNRHCSSTGYATEFFMISPENSTFKVTQWNNDDVLSNAFMSANASVELDPDTPRQIVIHRINMGYAPSQGRERWHTFSWVNNSLKLVNTRYQDTSVRAYLLHDANRLFENSEFDAAIEIYTKVIQEQQLEDIIEPFEDGGKNAVQSFAAFRLMLIATHANNPNEMQRWSQWLEQNSNEAWVIYSVHLFKQLETQSQNLKQICEQVRQFSKEAYPWKYDPWIDAGYANPILAPHDLCPL